MQSMDFDRCVRAVGETNIWMVREKSKSRVKFQTWEDYVDAEQPPFEVVTKEEMGRYRVAGQFRPLHRS